VAHIPKATQISCNKIREKPESQAKVRRILEMVVTKEAREHEPATVEHKLEDGR
jgi:hypothetical protein